METIAKKVVPFALGQKIIINSFLKRKISYYEVNQSYKNRGKEWVDIPLEKDKIVIVLGIRTLSNGTTEHDPEVGTMYSPETYLKALLVVGSLYEKPFYTPYPNN